MKELDQNLLDFCMLVISYEISVSELGRRLYHKARGSARRVADVLDPFFVHEMSANGNTAATG